MYDKNNFVTDVAAEFGFGGRETFSRAFKEVYGLSPSEYKSNPVALNNFDKPNLLLNYVMVDEGVPLITEGIVLEYNRRTQDAPVYFLGAKDFWRFRRGKMLGERPEVSGPAAVWDKFFEIIDDIPRIPNGRRVGVSYNGGAPEGYASYFAGAEINYCEAYLNDARFASWVLPAREYVVCEYEAEDFSKLMDSLGKMMKFTRLWLKKHGLTADGFFPEMYFESPKGASHAFMEMWIPFRERENKN